MSEMGQSGHFLDEPPQNRRTSFIMQAGTAESNAARLKYGPNLKRIEVRHRELGSSIVSGKQLLSETRTMRRGARGT
jgi:hypothetical protein